MYLEYFGLKQKPFLITPDPAFLYPSAGHQQALAHLRYGLDREGGFLLLTGEVGTGKTTLCRLLMDNLPDNFRLAYLLNTKLETGDLLAGICRELGIATDNSSDVNKLVEQIYDNLLDAHGANKRTLIVIEEAQNLSADVLETLRLLTNLETSATKLLHILLIGQPELLDTLHQSQLRQLNQRVVSRSHLGSLQRRDLKPYIVHRLAMAGTSRPLFSDSAMGVIYSRTGGIPRLVNLLSEHCLMGAYALGKSQVNGAIAKQAAKELLATLQKPHRQYPPLKTPALLVLTIVTALLLTSYFLPISSFEDNRENSDVALDVVEVEAKVQQVKAEMDKAEQVIEDFRAISDNESLLAQGDDSATDDGFKRKSVDQPAINAYQYLLTPWGAQGEEIHSEKQLCAVAERLKIHCLYLSVTSLNMFERILPPVLIKLFNDADGLDIFAVQEISANELVLANSAGGQTLSLDVVMKSMDPEILYLWQPPAGYSQPLTAGESNPLLVESLVRWLSTVGYLSENIITGGIYNDYLVEKVRSFQADNELIVDGVLGAQTLMMLEKKNSATEQARAVEE